MKVDRVIKLEDEMLFICDTTVYRYGKISKESIYNLIDYKGMKYKIIDGIMYNTVKEYIPLPVKENFNGKFTVEFQIEYSWKESFYNPIEKVKDITPYLKDII